MAERFGTIKSYYTRLVRSGLPKVTILFQEFFTVDACFPTKQVYGVRTDIIEALKKLNIPNLR